MLSTESDMVAHTLELNVKQILDCSKAIVIFAVENYRLISAIQIGRDKVLDSYINYRIAWTLY